MITNTQRDANYVEAMYRSLAIAAQPHADEFNESTLEALQKIATERHCGNGYWSWDGMLDDLTDLTGSEDIASEILNNC
jgi:hypothetical protein